MLSNNLKTTMPSKTDVNGTPGVATLSYVQMSDGTLLNGLNANGGGFSTVTVLTADGESLRGKYSFATSSALLGEDYPFPTILTQESAAGTVNVHYGDWPVAGIQRENGDLPVSIDLFADYTEDQKEAVWTEALTLSSLVTDTSGKLNAVVLDREGNTSSVANVEIAEDGFADRRAILTITGQRAGYAKIGVTYTASNAVYTTSINVSVTAHLQVLPATVPVAVFTNETATAPLTLRDANSDPLPDDLLTTITLQAQDFAPEIDLVYLKSAEVNGEDNTALELQLTSMDKIGETKVTLEYQYTYRGIVYTAVSPVTLQIMTPTVELKAVNIYLSGGSRWRIRWSTISMGSVRYR